MIPRIVLDTSILFAGLYSRSGPSFAVLDLLYKSTIGLHLSVPVFLEYQDVLLRNPERLHLTAEDAILVLDSLCGMAELHEIHYIWRPTLPDPGDEIFLELAVAAKCPFIVTQNLKDFPDTKRFGVEALTPIQFMKVIGVRK